MAFWNGLRCCGSLRRSRRAPGILHTGSRTDRALTRGRLRRARLGAAGQLRKNALKPRDHRAPTDVLHAGVIIGAAAQKAKIAGRARQVGAYNGVPAAIRAGPNRIGRAENAHHGPVERDREMHRAGIVTDANRRPAYERSELAERRLASEIDGRWG